MEQIKRELPSSLPFLDPMDEASISGEQVDEEEDDDDEEEEGNLMDGGECECGQKKCTCCDAPPSKRLKSEDADSILAPSADASAPTTYGVPNVELISSAAIAKAVCGPAQRGCFASRMARVQEYIGGFLPPSWKFVDCSRRTAPAPPAPTPVAAPVSAPFCPMQNFFNRSHKTVAVSQHTTLPTPTPTPILSTYTGQPPVPASTAVAVPKPTPAAAQVHPSSLCQYLSSANYREEIESKGYQCDGAGPRKTGSRTTKKND